MEQVKLGTENLTKAVLLIVECGNVADAVQHSTQQGAQKYAILLNLTDELMTIPGLKFDQLGKEYADLDAAEKESLQLSVKEKFDIADDKLEGVIEEAFGLVVDLGALVQRGIALAQKLKA